MTDNPASDSPCVNICVMHPAAGICVGCFRTLDEIAGWGSLSADQRGAILAQLPDRRSALRQRRGGRTRTRPAG